MGSRVTDVEDECINSIPMIFKICSKFVPMSLRREFMNYVGTGAIGGIIGYYVGAQGLLGIQSDSSATDSQNADFSNENERNSEELDDSQTGNTFSLEMYADGEQRFSETTTVEDVSTFLPDIVVGTDYDGEGGCSTSMYEAEITDMSISSGGSSSNIVDRVPLTEFARDDKRREVYSNPASGSDAWRLSFTIEPRGPEYTTPQSYNCASELMIRLTENGDWFNNSDQDAPNNQIQYEISTEQDGWKRHGVSIPGGSGDLNPNGDNLEDRGLYEENIEWEIIIERS